MQAHWATPKAIANSEKARASRMSDRGGIGPYSHVAGSRSFAKVKDVLVMFIHIGFFIVFNRHCFYIISLCFIVSFAGSKQ